MVAIFNPTKQFTQASRHLRIHTRLEQDSLLVRSLEGVEAISRLFHFDVALLSLSGTLNPLDLVGEKVGITLEPDQKTPRSINGYIKRFEYAGLEGRGLYQYQAEVVPWLWFLSKRTDCRVFQNQSIPDIVESIFIELGFADYSFALVEQYPPLEYCVQYNESDLDFVSRLLSHAGIFYYFEHQPDAHLLHLSDDACHYTDQQPEDVLHSSGSRKDAHIQRWQHSYHYCSGGYAQTDFDFEKCNHSLLTESATAIPLKNSTSFPQFSYPGLYQETDQGRALARLRMQQEEMDYEQVRAEANMHTLEVGKKFTLKSDENLTDHNQSFVVTEIRHQAHNPSYIQGDDKAPAYKNQLACIPANTTYRPRATKEKPRIDGVQTAQVVGKAGDEIYTDKYGRIKVQFHWDRYGGKNDESSCWVRVATQWAGGKWGMVGIPRVGQEVVVTFVNGDPDRPLVIGSVYNSAHMPPYNLPANKTVTGVKSRSSKGGDPSTYNEFVMDDKNGAEEVRINAQKDFNMNVGNNAALTTNGNRTDKVDGNVSTTVGGNTSHSTGGDDSHSVSGNRIANVDGNESLAVSGNQDCAVGGDKGEDIGGSATLSVGADSSISVSGKQDIDIGADQQCAVGGNQSADVGGNQQLEVGGSQTVSVGGAVDISAQSHNLSIGQSASLSAVDITQVAKSEIALASGAASISVTPTGITLAVGASSVTIDATGVSVSGPLVKLN